MQFPVYDPDSDRFDECCFVANNYGTLPLGEVKAHLENCGECQYGLVAEFYSYQHFPDLFPGVPEGIVIDDFLQVMSLVRARENEVIEHYMRNLERKLSTNFRLLMRMLGAMHRCFRAKASGSPWDLMQQHSKVLQLAYRELFKALGERETYLLLGMDDVYVEDSREKFGDFWKGWCLAFGLETPDQKDEAVQRTIDVV